MKNIITLLTILFLAHFGYTQNSSKTQFVPPGDFDGVYFELNFGSQNVFGGSYVNDMDMLAQDSKLVTEIALGYRKQFINNRLVAGLMFSIGFLDGDLEHVSPDELLKITWKNSSQKSFGGLAGILVGKHRRSLLFGYLNETKRKFDVAIDQPPYFYHQTDKQGMLKYGIGWEYQATKHLHFKTTFGGLRVDFGDLKTNINVEDKYDLMVGVIYQF